MERSTKSAWMEGGDLAEADVEDVPVPGNSVRVRALPAAYSNQAASEALKMTQVAGGDQVSTVDTAKLEVLQFAHGVIDPTFSVEDAEHIAQRYGPAFKKVVAKIDELSGVDKEAIQDANARFQGGGASANGSDVGDAAPARGDGPDVDLRAGREPAHDGAGDADR